jgi:hypothetical protein
MSKTVTDYLIGHHDMEQIYLSPDPYKQTFEETLDLCKWDLVKHRTGGLQFITKDSRLILASMDKSTPGAQIEKWHTRICGAWLQSINDIKVLSFADVHAAFHTLSMTNATSCTLTFSHPDILPNISRHGLPIISCDNVLQFMHDQLNNHLDLIKRGPLICRFRKYDNVQSGDVTNYTTQVMRLTRGHLLKQDDWTDWQTLEYLQLNQNADQGCFGTPTPVDKDNAVFHLVWTYNIKTLH